MSQNTESKHSALSFTDAGFQKDVLESSQPVLIDFWAGWCGPCRLLAPTIEDLARKFEGRIKVGKLDVDANGATAAAYGISAIPSVLVFKNGQVVDSFVGVQPLSVYEAALDRALA